jgi:thiol-disulfide isomerase/thioredoxin
MNISRSRLFAVAVTFAMLTSGAQAKDAELRRMPGNMTLPMLKAVDLEGREWNAGDLRGKVVVLNFWASWCEPCQDELPYLNELANSGFAKGKVVVVGIDFKEPADTVRRFAGGHKVDYPVLIDKTGEQFRRWTNGVLPTTVIIDRSGRARWRISGAIDRNDTALKKALEKMLAEPPPRQ